LSCSPRTPILQPQDPGSLPGPPEHTLRQSSRPAYTTHPGYNFASKPSEARPS
jgi:hypothetical protein